MKATRTPLFAVALWLGAASLPLQAQESSMAAAPAGAKGKPITEVAHFQDYQVTGIAVSTGPR